MHTIITTLALRHWPRGIPVTHCALFMTNARTVSDQSERIICYGTISGFTSHCTSAGGGGGGGGDGNIGRGGHPEITMRNLDSVSKVFHLILDLHVAIAAS